MPVQDFDIRPKAHASPTSRPIIVSNKLRQDPMVRRQASSPNPTPAIKTKKKNQTKNQQSNQSVVTNKPTVRSAKKSKNKYVIAIAATMLLIVLINFLLDANIVTFWVPLLPFTNLF